MKSELKRIQRVIHLMGEIGNGTEGFIERRTKGRNRYFYLCARKNGERKRVYLGKENSVEVKKAVSVMYRCKQREILSHNRDVLEEALGELWDDSVDGIFGALSKNCKEACSRGFLDKRMEELKDWAAEDYPRNTYAFQDAENIAADGTRLRSKGEVIWYNLLLAAGIPFRYEWVIKVRDDNGLEVEVCPDFVIQCYDGTMIAIEHLGKLDSEKYRHDTAVKIRLYQKLGYVLGDTLFFTSDDAHYGTNSEMIARKIQEIETMFYHVA